MESINSILEDNSTSGTEKLQKVNVLLDTNLERHEENINIDMIFNANTENNELKYDVLRKVLISATNFEDNLERFINYFKITFNNFKNHKLLAKCLEFICKIKKYNDKMQNILNELGIENVNKVLLDNVFLEKSYEDSAIFNTYLRYLSIDDQVMFFNNVFELSEIHQNVGVLYQTVQILDKDALTHDKSILRTQDLWFYLSNCLVNNRNHQDTQTVFLILQSCLKLVKNEPEELAFLSVVDGDENAWNAFFALMEMFINQKQQLIGSSLQLISYLSSLHYFWERCVYAFLVAHTPIYLKCEDTIFFLKQPVKDENINIFFKLIFSAINERKCNNEECPVFTELNNFCENSHVENLPIILDELLNISWHGELLWTILGNVLVDSKKQSLDFPYFTRVLRHIEEHNFSNFPRLQMDQIPVFFYDPDNVEFWTQIRESSLPLSTYQLAIPEKLENMAISKLIELSRANSDDLMEIEKYLGFLRKLDTYIDVIKNYPVGIHVRIAMYSHLFNINGYVIAQTELDEDKTVNDFHEYLLKYLNEKTYICYRELMLSFLDIMDMFMIFTYPEKACSEFIKIILNPELYTKYQIYCTTEILRRTYYRFSDLNTDNCYIKIAQKWKHLILETADIEICKQGLYFVLGKGQLNEKEYYEIVKKLLEKHYCDDVTEEIYSSYLDDHVMNIAFKRLIDIKETSIKNYEKLSKLFCEAVVSDRYIFTNQFSCENEEFKFCCLNRTNLETTIREIGYRDYSDDAQFKTNLTDVIIEIYLNKLSNIENKVYCLHVILKIVVRYSYADMPSKYSEYFKKDVEWIIIRFKEKYAQNFEDDVCKLRIVQALFLLIPHVMHDFNNKFKRVKRSKVNDYKKLRNILKRIVVGILVKESDSKNNAVKQICQYMYVLLSQRDVAFKDGKRIIEKIKEQPNLACSFMPVLYHVMPFCKLTENEVEEIFASMFSLLLIFDDKLRIYTQMALQHFYILYNNEQLKRTIEKYALSLDQINLDMDSNKNKITDILKTDYVFLKVLDPLCDHPLAIVLYILPKLNRVDSSEWENIMDHRLSWDSRFEKSTYKKDEKQTIKKFENYAAGNVKIPLENCE